MANMDTTRDTNYFRTCIQLAVFLQLVGALLPDPNQGLCPKTPLGEFPSPDPSIIGPPRSKNPAAVRRSRLLLSFDMQVARK